VVLVLNVVDGCVPSDMSAGSTENIEEERRLLYVAMTRAKDQLALFVPHRCYLHGQARGGDRHLLSRTRFIPASLLSQFQVCSWPPTARAAPSSGRDSGVTLDLAARMRGKWRSSGT
jgi:DNA helicase-2/ATP-dependent DNA helicase PcrA